MWTQRLKRSTPAGRALAALLGCSAAALAPAQAHAWGDEGHEIVGYIAYALLTPAAKAKVDAMLAADTDTLTAPDFAARATWADRYRDADNRRLHYQQTRQWHFVDTEISAPDLQSACFGFPPLPAGALASQGPAKDCAANKISEFAAELADPGTAPAERLMALKFVMHFVGDLHQPLHASDDHDQGGNCEQVQLTPADPTTVALHHFWDTEVVNAVIADDRASHPGASLSDVADDLRGAITPAQLTTWQADVPKTWALESFQVALSKAWVLPPHAPCPASGPYPTFLLPAEYQAAAEPVAREQLQRAGVRLAFVLNQALS